ncbi:hypothetical protein [Pontimicrobium sp. MEBiC06410]
MSILYLFAGLLTLTVLHELGHVISALFLKLRIFSVGITMLPYPHPYVKVENTENKLHRYIFFYSGIAMTVTLLLICLFNGFLSYKMLYYAFAIELIIELNPFYSDIFLVNVDSNDYGKFNFSVKGKRKLYFIFWVVLIFLFFSPFGFQRFLTFN